MSENWHYSLSQCCSRDPCVCCCVFCCYIPSGIPGICCCGLQHFHSKAYWKFLGNPPIHVESGYVYKGTNRPVMAINSIFGEEYLKECCCCQYQHRAQIRDKYNIKGDIKKDWLYFCLLPCCTAMQDINEINYQEEKKKEAPKIQQNQE